ncbi:uracil-DNA glycosylase [Halorientalis pallida]|uniref:Uracil-DNA glycosylase n=1 Tax=Halorientalis pallida TaxID=2479928 RepID=A0A498L322_9EURY|nr:uracil-DNA glycosylase [Halorientalis pallida]RXK50174.1 uracil-DNA glycosylase [Halorientalis pallida]
MPTDPEDRNPLAEDCRRCPALVEGRECISWGNGPLDADLVVVGEAPGYGDPDADRWRGGNWTGMAYTSRHSGRRIRTVLADAGYGPDECYFTNAVKCFPAAPEEPTTNREPTEQERANCRPYLREEIETVAPRAVVTTGKHATRSVLAMVDRDCEGFLDAVLSPVDCPDLSTTVLPLLHPSYQDVWLSRLEYTRAEYVDAIGQAVAEW